MKRYFAYGSNMDAAQMTERCPDSEKKEVRELTGYEFFVNKRGVANIRQNKGKKVIGIIYDISENDESKLDKCEGLKYGTNKKVYLPEVDAFYYLAKEIEEGLPRYGYLEKIIEAAKTNTFPKEYIDELKSWAK